MKLETCSLNQLIEEAFNALPGFRPHWEKWLAFADQLHPTTTDLSTFESPTGYHLVVELPGVSKENVQLQVDNRLLTVTTTGECKHEKSYQLPEIVDLGGIQANLENGLLIITLPKQTAAQTRTIAIG
jgi:HSP20 family protein